MCGTLLIYSIINSILNWDLNYNLTLLSISLPLFKSSHQPRSDENSGVEKWDERKYESSYGHFNVLQICSHDDFSSDKQDVHKAKEYEEYGVR